MSWQGPHQSPHSAQIHLNTPNLEFHIDPPFHRVLAPSHQQRPYYRRTDAVKTCLHWGQRKLLISKIKFLTIIGSAALIDSTVVYAGAAPGTHIQLLSVLFPPVKFILVDPAPFTVKQTDRMTSSTASSPTTWPDPSPPSTATSTSSATYARPTPAHH
jgi:hypothetical protein